MLLYAPCFQGYFLFSSFGLKAPVFADPEAGFACSCELLCTYSSTASRSFNNCPVSLFCTYVSWVLSLASPKNCLFNCFCLVGYCFCMGCCAAAPLCHFSSFVILSLLLAAVLRAFVHSCSYSCQLFLSCCLGGFGELFQGGSRILLNSVCIRSCMSLYACLPAGLVSLCCMTTLWRPFLSLLNPSSLRLVHLVLSLKPLTGPPFEN